MSQVLGRVLLPLLVLPLAMPALAQGVRFGLKGGVPISEYFETGDRYSSATRRYMLGPSIELNVWNNFSLEVDALYRRIGYSGTSRSPTGHPFFGVSTTSTFNVRGGAWDFPILLKYRFVESFGPYLAGGGMVRKIGPIRARGTAIRDDRISNTITTTPIDTSDPIDLRKRTWPGLTFAAGFEFGRRRFRISSEFRYTRITSNIGEPTQRTLRLEQNQLEFLLGFLF